MVDLKKKRPRVEYFTHSIGKFIDIEDMHEKHLINAIRKLVLNDSEYLGKYGVEFRVVHETHAEKVYVTSTTTEVEMVTE